MLFRGVRVKSGFNTCSEFCSRCLGQVSPPVPWEKQVLIPALNFAAALGDCRFPVPLEKQVLIPAGCSVFPKELVSFCMRFPFSLCCLVEGNYSFVGLSSPCTVLWKRSA